MTTDRELLFGVLSVQLGFANAQRVMECADAWLDQGGGAGPFDAWLVAQGALSESHRVMVEGVVREVLADGRKYDTLVTTGGGGLMDPPETAETSQRTEPSFPGAVLDEDGGQVLREARGRYDYGTGPNGDPQLLGKGGIGRVVVVHDRFLGRDVAMKELLGKDTHIAEAATDKSTALEARFLREARVTGQLEHPAIVPVYEVGQRQGGEIFYTMQRVRGGTLHEASRKAKNLVERLALLPHFVAVCQAIAYAHSRGIVHRDIKPQNVMVGPFGETVVLDWGLARLKGRPDDSRSDMRMAPDITGNALRGAAIGTPAYMSPEQAAGRNEEIDERSDVWGLGALLYELLTGRPPYDGPTPIDVLSKILRDPVEPVRTRAPAVPVDLAAICDKALSKDRARRYPSAEALKEDIEAFMAGRKVAAHEYTSWELVRRFTYQNRVVLSVLGALVISLLSWSAVVYVRVRTENEDARTFAQAFFEEVTALLTPVPGAAQLVDDVASRTLGYYARNVDRQKGPVADRRRLVEAYLRLGRTSLDLAKFERAREVYRAARETAEGVVRERPDEVWALVLLCDALVGEWDAAVALEGPEAEWPLLERSRGVIERAMLLARADRAVLNSASRVYSRMGMTRTMAGDRAAGLVWLDRALKTDQQLVELAPDHAETLRGLVITTGQVAYAREEAGLFDEAARLYQEAYELSQRLVRMEPANAEWQRLQGEQQLVVGSLMRRRGMEEKAKPHFEEAARLFEALRAADPGLVQIHAMLLTVALERGDAAAVPVAEARLRKLTDAAEQVPLFLLADLFQGDLRSADRWIRSGKLQQPATLAVFGAVTAALQGDRRAALEALQGARRQKLKDWPAWARDRVLPGPLPDVGEAPAVRAFLTDVDQAWARGDYPAFLAALEHFEAALRALPPPVTPPP